MQGVRLGLAGPHQRKGRDGVGRQQAAQLHGPPSAFRGFRFEALRGQILLVQPSNHRAFCSSAGGNSTRPKNLASASF